MIRSLKHKIVAIAGCIAFLFALYSCGQNEPYFQYNELKEGKWVQHDTLYFNIDSTTYETGIPYNIYLETTNNVNYPYQNIWFFAWDNIDNDSVYTRIEKEYTLADEFGKWTGSGFGSLYQSTFPYKEHIIFKEKRNISIKVLHGMQDEPLDGIEKVGVRMSYKR